MGVAPLVPPSRGRTRYAQCQPTGAQSCAPTGCIFTFSTVSPAMTDNSPPPTEGAPRPQSVWQNWITLAGVIEAAGSLFAFLLLFALDLMGRGARNPYLGILCYVVAPGFLFFGAAVAVAGAWRERRLRSRGRAMRPPRLAIDLSRSRDRRILLWFSFGGSTFLLL